MRFRFFKGTLSLKKPSKGMMPFEPHEFYELPLPLLYFHPWQILFVKTKEPEVFYHSTVI